MALVVGVIIFPVLCKQTLVVKFVQKFLHYSNCQDDKGVLFAHVDDVLFAIDEQYLNSVVNPILEARFRISVQAASRSGGSFELLKRVHEFEPNYESLEISHLKQTYQTIFFKPLPG